VEKPRALADENRSTVSNTEVQGNRGTLDHRQYVYQILDVEVDFDLWANDFCWDLTHPTFGPGSTRAENENLSFPTVAGGPHVENYRVGVVFLGEHRCGLTSC